MGAFPVSERGVWMDGLTQTPQGRRLRGEKKPRGLPARLDSDCRLRDRDPLSSLEEVSSDADSSATAKSGLNADKAIA